ncbi:relaxin-3 receptor 2 [Microcaecilia unicolor]|uniref:Relaxin-3 receptor 2 n=1 Tax=Microcaecilia unicolor TaxID=1415580 RepID=A0A6P7WHI7_9AMPH|nr:relaxin-3 receptor 2 [Microcaecilia unicolor]
MHTNVSHLAEPSNNSVSGSADNSTDDAASIPMNNLLSLRICISICYSLVCMVGLLGNGLVMYLIRSRKGRSPPIDVFVFYLALTDFQFALTLPFWAVETLLDFSWPFGNTMCKIVLTMTMVNIYTNVFLLVAMSITRYWSVASAVSPRFRLSARTAKWITLGLWVVAVSATTPTAIFAVAKDVHGEKLCLLKFPDLRWLGVYHLHKIIVAFILPVVIITSSYLMLCQFLNQHYLKVNHLRTRREITNSILLLVLVFFICWLPNHAATFWGVLMKFDVVPYSSAYNYFHTYIFPATTCLAHSSSCLNPLVYYLLRRKCRKTLNSTMFKAANYLFSCLSTSGPKRSKEHTQAAMLLNPKDSLSCPQQSSHRSSKKCCLTSTVRMCMEKIAVSCHYVAISLCFCRFICVILSSVPFVSCTLVGFPYVKKKNCVGPRDLPSNPQLLPDI